jgi:hypothetical protein
VSVGFPTNKGDVDSRAGSLAVTVRDDLARIRQFKAWLDTQTDGNLTGLTYTTAEVATLRSAYTDLDKLAQVYLGLATQGTTYDFQTFAKLLTGVV